MAGCDGGNRVTGGRSFLESPAREGIAYREHQPAGRRLAAHGLEPASDRLVAVVVALSALDGRGFVVVGSVLGAEGE